jgi:hypothetical protein
MNTNTNNEIENKEIKITGKTTKSDLARFINDSFKSLKDQSIKDQVVYTAKAMKNDPNSVTRDILYTLAKDIEKSLKTLVNTSAPTPVEASVKPKLSSKNKNKDNTAEKTSDEKTEPKTDTKQEDSKQEQKTDTSKKPSLSKNKKKDEKEATTETKKVPTVTFPDSITHKLLGTLTAQPDKYTTMKEIAEAVNSGKNLVFACHWTKKQIGEFNYAQTFDVKVPRDGFENDLDLLQLTYVCETVNKLYALSTDTEAMFKLDEEDFIKIDGIRYSNGMEFEVYEITAEPQPEK